MHGDMSDSILAKTELFIDRVKDAGATARLETPRTINETGAFYERIIDLATDFTGNGGLVDIPNAGFGLVMAIQGSTPGAALNMSFDGSSASQVTNFRPGAFYKASFGRIVLTKASDCVDTGQVRLIFLTRNDVDYTEFFSGSAGSKQGGGSGIGPSGASTQAYNTASRGANAPVLATDGVSLAGVQGFKCSVKLASSTIAGGQLRFWWYDPTNGWERGPIVDALDTGAIQAVSSEFETKVSLGRVYAEAVNVTAAAGAPLVTVVIWTFGS